MNPLKTPFGGHVSNCDILKKTELRDILFRHAGGVLAYNQDIWVWTVIFRIIGTCMIFKHGVIYMGVLIESVEMKKMIYWSRFSRNSSLQHIGISNIWLSHQDLQMEILKGEVLGHLKCLEHTSCQQPTLLHFHSPIKQKELFASYASSCMHSFIRDPCFEC